MRYPIETATQKITPVERESAASAPEAASASRSFIDILAEAESVQDVVELGRRLLPQGSSVLPAAATIQESARTAWRYLCQHLAWLGVPVHPDLARQRAVRRRFRSTG